MHSDMLCFYSVVVITLEYVAIIFIHVSTARIYKVLRCKWFVLGVRTIPLKKALKNIFQKMFSNN